ncbi:MAG: PKD domain-containing protein [Bacteroidota bacterium]|nr:PKD domain-containing protein [Bacteroidota bacterium]
MKTTISYTLLVILSALAFTTGCKKKDLLEPNPNQNTNIPEFTMTAVMNGSPVNIEAGSNDYYMYSSFYQDSNNVYTFLGNLKPINCSSSACANTFSFELKDAQISSPNGNSSITNALYPGYFPYRNGSPAAISYSMQFLAQTASTNYSWNFGDGSTSTLANPTHTFSRFGSYNVCLTTGDSLCNSSLCNPYKIGNPGTNCQISNIYVVDSLGVVVFNHFITGTLPFTYSWDFGDGSTSTASNPQHTYSSSGLYHVTLQVTDGNGDVANANYDYINQPFSGCTTAFAQNFKTPISNPMGFSNIVINWTDANGTVYSSDNAAQPASSYFQIVSVADFQNNENNQTTKKLHVKFNCILYSGSGNITVTNGDAIIAVAYK